MMTSDKTLQLSNDILKVFRQGKCINNKYHIPLEKP